MSPADNFYKQFGPRPGLTNCQAWSGSNYLTLWWYSWENVSKKLILEKKIRRQKKREKFKNSKSRDLREKHNNVELIKMWYFSALLGVRGIYFIQVSAVINILSADTRNCDEIILEKEFLWIKWSSLFFKRRGLWRHNGRETVKTVKSNYRCLMLMLVLYEFCDDTETSK